MRNKKEGVKYLEYLTGYGLDSKALQDFKKYGMLYCSIRYTEEFISVEKFLDTNKHLDEFDAHLIEYVQNIERDNDITPYHIVINGKSEYGTEVDVFYIDNNIDYHEFQWEDLTNGIAQVYKIYLEDKLIYPDTTNFKVKFGGILDTSFVPYKSAKKLNYPNGKK